MKILVLVIGFSLFISCKSSNKNNSLSLSNEGIDTLTSKIDNNAKNKEKEINISSFFKILNIESIKKETEGKVTSTFLSERKTEIYPTINEGYYGLYFFVNDIPKTRKERPFNSIVTIFNNETPWNFSSSNDKLIELVIYTSDVVFAESIMVGASKKAVIEKLGQPITEKEQYMFYKDKNNNYALTIALTKNDIIAKIIIGKYKKGISLSEIINRKTRF